MAWRPVGTLLRKDRYIRPRRNSSCMVEVSAWPMFWLHLRAANDRVSRRGWVTILMQYWFMVMLHILTFSHNHRNPIPISQPKMHQISLGDRALPGPAGGAYSAPPETPSWIKRTFGIPHPRSCFAKRCKNVASKMQCTWYDSARTHWMSLQHGQNLHSRKKVIKYCTDVLCTLVKL